jgi:spore maturation protein CgeB
VYAGWVESLRQLGQQVFEFNLGDRLTFYASVLQEVDEGRFKRALNPEQAIELAVNGLYAGLMKVRPHVLLLVSAFFIPPELIAIARAAGVKVVVHHTESPYEDHRQIQVADCDLNLLNDPQNIDQFLQVAPTIYMPHAYREILHHPGPVDADLVCDFSFVGTGYPSRIAFFEALNLQGLTVRLAGNWQILADESPIRPFVEHELSQCLDNEETVRLYQSTRVGLNLYRRESEGGKTNLTGWAIGPREVEMAATGLFFLRDPRPEGDELFPSLPTFTGPEDASEQIRWWARHDTQRQAAAGKARAAIADRTFALNARRLMQILVKE